MKKTISTFSLLLCIVGGTVSFAAERADNCHCFRNRIYTPDDKYAADDYLLTTVFNSLTAKYFGITKRRIVMMKMKGGVSGDNLLIGLYLSKCTGTDVSELLAQKRKKSWQQILSSTGTQTQPPDNCGLTDQLTKKGPVVEDIIQEMLKNLFAVTDQALNSLRKQGLSSQEISVVLTLARHLQMEPDMISSQYKNKKFSWSEIASNFGLEPAEVGKLAGQPSPRRE